MKRIFAYSLFWFAMGMMVMLVLHNEFLGIILIAACLFLSYFLFGC